MLEVIIISFNSGSAGSFEEPVAHATASGNEGVQYVDKKVYVDTPNMEEKNIISESYAKIALLVLENQRLRGELNNKKSELSRL